MAESPKEENPIIVLKFGGSVLTDEDRLGLAVHEIYRWRRDGWRVVAVVSALQGETEALITKGDGLGADTCGHAKATLIGLGEAKSAAILGLLLDRSGIPARVLSPAALGLICGGKALNATPERVDTRCVRSGLEEDGVVVIPGFIGIDNHARQVTLGRGGSDSTAVFLAAQLEAERCRLIKDVDGLYNADPAQSHESRPDRYEIARYEDALTTDGSIIQHESVELARALGVRIELCSLNSSTPSVIGVDSHRFSPPRARPAPLRVAVCGLGTVGAGVVRQLALWKDDFVLVGGACRTPQKQTGLLEDLGSITTDPVSLAREHVDIVVELIGGVELAYEIVTTALSNGKHVITANKALIAERGRSLRALAEANGVELLFSASVGGSLPVLERLRQLDPVNISGVLNGTSQFVLNAIARGGAFTDAIEHAQRLGFAEADPSRDLDAVTRWINSASSRCSLAGKASRSNS